MHYSIPIFSKLLIDVNENLKKVDRTRKQDFLYLNKNMHFNKIILKQLLNNQLSEYSIELESYRENLEKIKLSLENLKINSRPNPPKSSN